MDIEGAEQRAVEGPQETLARFRPRLALSAYHQTEDPEQIASLVGRARPDYRMVCGPCALERDRITPRVLLFE